MAEHIIHSPELLHISEQGRVCYGADQLWFPRLWQRKSGCGPTSASHLLWYLSQTREGCEALCPYDGGSREGFVMLMRDVWRYVTPGLRGANRTSFVSEGAVRYGADRQVGLSARVLEVSAEPSRRPSSEETMQFLTGALADDLPVAFLNLSNGALQNLDNWHWVTLIGASPSSGTAEMYDQRAHTVIDLALWLRTTSGGGGFVAIEPRSV